MVSYVSIYVHPFGKVTTAFVLLEGLVIVSALSSVTPQCLITIGIVSIAPWGWTEMLTGIKCHGLRDFDNPLLTFASWALPWSRHWCSMTLQRSCAAVKLLLSSGESVEEAWCCTEASLYVIPGLENINSASVPKIQISIICIAFTHRHCLLFLAATWISMYFNFWGDF